MATVKYINMNKNSNGCIFPIESLPSNAGSMAVAPVTRRFPDLLSFSPWTSMHSTERGSWSGAGPILP